MSKPKATIPAKPAPLPTDTQALFALAKRAQDGDKDALPAVRELLKHSGAIEALGGNGATNAMDALLAHYTGNNLMAREAVNHKLDQLRTDLARQTEQTVGSSAYQKLKKITVHATGRTSYIRETWFPE